MLKKKEIQELLNEALSTGADFAEIFFENSVSSTIKVISGEVTSVDASNIHGVGVRLIEGIDEVYGFTNQVSYDSILKLVTNLRASFKGELHQADLKS